MSLQKKIQSAREEGYTKGFNHACSLWEHVIKHTSGVGPVLQSRLMDTIHQVAAEIHKNRK